jgi:hypothetical protein
VNIRFLTELTLLGPGQVTEPVAMWARQLSVPWDAVPLSGATIAFPNPGDEFKPYTFRVGSESRWFVGDIGVIEIKLDNTYYSNPAKAKTPGTTEYLRPAVEARLRSAGFRPIESIDLWW